MTINAVSFIGEQSRNDNFYATGFAKDFTWLDNTAFNAFSAFRDQFEVGFAFKAFAFRVENTCYDIHL